MKFYTKEEFFELANHFNDDINNDNPTRSENETFAEFIDKGSKVLSKDYKSLLEYLL